MIAAVSSRSSDLDVNGNNGDFDFWVLKISDTTKCLPTYGTDTKTACNAYTWIDGNTYTSSNYTATHTLTNAAGCDSIITLNLIISTIDSSVTQNGSALTANISGATYQWLECITGIPNGFSILSGMTSQSFTATGNGNYAVEITQNGCIDTSACYSITSVGVVENDLGEELLIYPNPFTHATTIVFENEEQVAYELLLYDVLGNQVRAIENITTNEVLIEKGHLTPGVYFISLQGNGKALRGKLMVE